MPPDTVYSAVSRITKGRYSASSACTRLTRAAPAPNTAAKGSRKASAQAAVNFPKCRCQKWGATSGTRAIDSSMPAKGTPQSTDSWPPSISAARAQEGTQATSSTNNPRKAFMVPSPLCSVFTVPSWQRAAQRSSLCRGRRDLEHLAQIGQVFLVVAHALARRVRELGHGLAVAARHLDDDLQRHMVGRVAQVIGQVGADAKGQLAAPVEALEQLDGARHRQAVAEDQRLGQRVDAVGAVVGQQPLAPLERVPAVMARAIEELAEVQVEIAQEGRHAVDVRQRNAQVAPVLARPGLEAEDLAVAQARAQRLAGLQGFMGHRA